MSASPFRFELQNSEGYSKGVIVSGQAEDIHSAIMGAWWLSRDHEALVDVFDQRDGAPPLKIAEVGVRWIDTDDEDDEDDT